MKNCNFIINPDVMWKFGYTDMADVNQRFSEETARIRNFANVPLGRDYIPSTKWSAFFPLEDAIEMEKKFKEAFPVKNLYTDVFYNGITECRYFTDKEARSYLRILYDAYPKSIYSFVEGYMKVYFTRFDRKA